MSLDNESVRSIQGQRLRRIREACGKSQSEWGILLGVTAMTIQNMEKGRSPITADRLEALERCRIRACDYVVNGSGDMFGLPYDEVLAAIDAVLCLGAADSGVQAAPESRGHTSSPEDGVQAFPQ